MLTITLLAVSAAATATCVHLWIENRRLCSDNDALRLKLYATQLERNRYKKCADHAEIFIGAMTDLEESGDARIVSNPQGQIHDDHELCN